jgi:hypothetical protein
MTGLNRTLIVIAIVVAFGVMASTASAGWAGSVYKRSDCTYDATSDVLYCETHDIAFTDRRTEIVYLEDASCTSGYRMFERTGRYTRTFSIWYDWYEGELPKWENNIGGNEIPKDEYWEPNYKDEDLGCYPAP